MSNIPKLQIQSAKALNLFLREARISPYPNTAKSEPKGIFLIFVLYIYSMNLNDFYQFYSMNQFYPMKIFN